MHFIYLQKLCQGALLKQQGRQWERKKEIVSDWNRGAQNGKENAELIKIKEVGSGDKQYIRRQGHQHCCLIRSSEAWEE